MITEIRNNNNDLNVNVNNRDSNSNNENEIINQKSQRKIIITLMLMICQSAKRTTKLITVRMTAPSQTNVRRIPTDLDYIAGAARVRCGILTCGQYFYQRRCRRQLLFCLSCTAITVHHASPFELVFQSELRDFRTLSPEGAGIPRRLPDLRRLTRGSSVSV